MMQTAEAVLLWITLVLACIVIGFVVFLICRRCDKDRNESEYCQANCLDWLADITCADFMELIGLTKEKASVEKVELGQNESELTVVSTEEAFKSARQSELCYMRLTLKINAGEAAGQGSNEGQLQGVGNKDDFFLGSE